MGGRFEEFSALNNFERMGFVVLGCENWERYDFKALLKLVKCFILLIWETRKTKLYGDRDGTGETSGYSCSCPLTGDLSSSACVCGGVVNGISVTAVTSVYYYKQRVNLFGPRLSKKINSTIEFLFYVVTGLVVSGSFRVLDSLRCSQSSLYPSNFLSHHHYFSTYLCITSGIGLASYPGVPSQLSFTVVVKSCEGRPRYN